MVHTEKAKRAKRLRKPKHRTVTRAYDFVMDVTAKQNDWLLMWIAACWRLRNDLVEDRARNRAFNRDIKQQGETDVYYLSQSDHYKAISEYVRRDTALSKVHSQVRQNVAVRVEEGYKRFFEALKEGRPNVRPPQQIEFKRYRSITFPQYGTAAHIRNSKLYLSGLGEFQLYDYRRVRGKPKTVTVKFKQGKWHCIVTAEAQEKDVIELLSPDDPRYDAGIDTGLETLMTDSFGEKYDPPRAWYDYRKKLRHAQQKQSRQFEARKREHAKLAAQAKAANKPVPSLKDMPYSHRLKAQIKQVAILHTKIERIRDHHHKKNAAIIADRYRKVAVEEHSLQFMIRNRKLAKAVSDRAIHQQKLRLRSKMGTRYIEAPNRTDNGGNSQVCTCGGRVPKELTNRIHICPSCRLRAGRDHVAANIVSIIIFGYVSTSLSPAAGQAVVRRGEDKEQRSESSLCESQPIEASESSVKRQPPVQEQSTTGGEPTVKGKTRRPGIADCHGIAA